MHRIRILKTIMLIVCVSALSACSTTIDRGNFGQFKRSLNTKAHGYSVAKDITNSAPAANIEVFEVRPGDCGRDGGWSDCSNDRERSELAQAVKDNRPGNEYWYGWYIYFPEDYPNVYPTKVALGQFHQDKSYPVWMFQNSSGGYHLDDQVPGYTRRYYQLLDDDNLRGKWHKIEVHVKWAQDDDGFFKVWANGELKVDYLGQTMKAQQVYFKYGLYRSFMSFYKDKYNKEEVPAQTVYYAYVRRGKSRADLQPAKKTD